MWEVCLKEIRGFFSSLIGYLVIGVFVLILGLMMWVFPDFTDQRRAMHALEEQLPLQLDALVCLLGNNLLVIRIMVLSMGLTLDCYYYLLHLLQLEYLVLL